VVALKIQKPGRNRFPVNLGTGNQQAFDNVKAALAKEVTLAYPDYSEEFEISTDGSKKQLGAVITQKNRPIAFFSCKLSEAQQKYSVTEIECGVRKSRSIDHQNLMRDALGLNSDRVYRWRLLLEEYDPEIVYIKGIFPTQLRMRYCAWTLALCSQTIRRTGWFSTNA
jgi:hypothetical protein